jgi:outer membrane protein, heavy metal efflux system
MMIEFQALLPGRSAWLALLLVSCAATVASAQIDSGRAVDPDSLAAVAAAAHPAVRAAEARVEASRAAIGPASALPDPMLVVGLMNQPIGPADPAEMPGMTMRAVGFEQTLPFPGRLELQRRVAERELVAAEASLAEARRAVEREVKEEYYEIAYLDRAIEIVGRNQALLGTLSTAAENQYGVGQGSQADVLRSRVELSRLAEQAVGLAEERATAAARLNATLDRPSNAAIGALSVPTRIAALAVAADPRQISFASASLGARAAGSPLPPLSEVQERAVRNNPSIRTHEAMIAVQAARVELARRAHLPDFDVTVQYGQRPGMRDMISATVSVPIPVRRGGKQQLELKGAEAEMAALEAEHQAAANRVRAEVAAEYSDLERERAQLALYVKSIIPQGRAALQSATASYQVGRADLSAVLESQATLFEYETAYHRSLTRFAQRLAALEETVGEEVVR